MVLLSLTGACPSCVPASLSQHPWVTGSPLAQSAVVLPSSWVEVEPELTPSQLLCHYCVTWLLAVPVFSVTGEKMAVALPPKPAGVNCIAILPWQYSCTEDWGAAHPLGGGRTQMDPAILLFLVPVFIYTCLLCYWREGANS